MIDAIDTAYPTWVLIECECGESFEYEGYRENGSAYIIGPAQCPVCLKEHDE